MFDSILHPIFMMLSGVATFILGWNVYFIRSFRISSLGFNKRISTPYILYSLSLFIWVLSNAFFYSPLLPQVEESTALAVALFTNIVSFSSFVFVCAITQVLVSDIDNNWSRKGQSLILISLSILAGYLNYLPGRTINHISIKGVGRFTIELGPEAIWFFFSIVILLALTIRNIWLYSRKTRALQQIRSIYMFVSIFILMLSPLIFNDAIPIIWRDFSMIWLPATFAIASMLLIGYALITSRFYSHRYVAYSMLAFVFSNLIIMMPLALIINSLSSEHINFAIIVSCLLTGFTWQKIYQSTLRYSSQLVYGQKLSPDNKIRSLSNEFQKSTSNAFTEIAKTLGIEQHDLQLVSNLQDEKIYTSQLYGQDSVLIYDEIEELILNNHSINKMLENIYYKMKSENVALVLPIFDYNNSMSHLLLVKKKRVGHLYFCEEVKALQHVLIRAQGYINADRKVHQAQALANSIAHEMRNPLAQVQFQFELLEAKLEQSSCQQELSKELTNGKMAIERGRQLIDIILREVNDSALEHEPTHETSIRSSITQAVERYAYESGDIRERIEININPDFCAKVNETLFNFVIFNLLRNAIYYFDSYPDSMVEIKTLSGKYENFLIIRDTGPGIPTSLLKRIFDDFFTYSKSGGSGLGLGYCRRVMKSFGGSIQCYSKIGEYTEFHLSFPAGTLPSSPRYQPELNQDLLSLETNAKVTLPPQIQMPTIMVVDDKEVQRHLVKLLLNQLGYDVILANNGQVAVDTIAVHNVDFVFMDIQMPVMNGFEAASMIRKMHPGLPIYALSGESGYIELEKIRQTMDGRLTKPTTKEALKQTIENAFLSHN
ncbi:hybrid sensor histidine kinase/response regulator [Vibrio kasasachensis]|uniref:hybrid sensor histidine kinase/response regulator n=1 Tax=Vibrio kasasachensis TaxID=2910248 RepID=UPI003D0D4726